MEKAYIEQNYPLLSRIDSPADLRKLSVEMLPAVCSELRRFLIESLSTNPGHFASSMGSVDFTVALHYVFDTPNDRIVWDVGHQAYGHKILTGRRDVFENNRKYNGLSGFPNPKESEYDSFIAGHASNSISAALGMSMAAELQGVEHRNVVAVIGDASISGGLAFEAMNNASINRNNLIILLNDNDMAIDQNVGAIGEYMSHLNTSRRYNNFKFKVYRFCLRHKIINEKSRGLILRFSNSLKALLTNQQNLFEGLNIRYFGPFDGHDVKKLVSIFTELKNLGELPEDTASTFFVLKKKQVAAVFFDSEGMGADTYQMVFKLLKTYQIPDETLFSIIRIFDSNIQSLQMVDDHNYRVSICNVERVLSDKELLHMLSSGTTKGIILYTLVVASLQQGFDLLVDEAETHFHKTLVENMISLYLDKTVNKHGATLLFSTHYCEVLDLFNRQDNIWVCQANDRIAVKNMYESFGVRSGLLKS